MHSIPPADAILSAICLFGAYSALHASSWSSICPVLLRMAETMASMPPAAAIFIALSSCLLANMLKRARHACICKSLLFLFLLMAPITQPMPPATPILAWFFSLTASPHRTKQARYCSCQTALWESIAAITHSMLPASPSAAIMGSSFLAIRNASDSKAASIALLCFIQRVMPSRISFILFFVPRLCNTLSPSSNALQSGLL